MKSIDPKWSIELSRGRRPGNPLGASGVRNGIIGQVAFGLPTTVTQQRARYFSLLCWAIDRVASDSRTESLSLSRQRAVVRRLEELVALTSKKYQEETSPDHGLAGVIGSNNLGNEDTWESDPIDLDEFSLRRSDYAADQYNSMLQDFGLKRGELNLTQAGQTLAEAVATDVSPDDDRLFEHALSKQVPQTTLSELGDSFALQAIYTHPEKHRQERVLLRKALLGYLSWNELDSTVSFTDLPEHISVAIESHFDYTVAETTYDDPMRHRLASDQPVLRRAFALFILRARQLYTDGELSLSPDDKDTFDGLRQLFRVYWLQTYAAYALTSQLEALCTHLQQAAPAAVHRSETFNELLNDDLIASHAHAVTNLTSVETSETLSCKAATRELLCYDTAGQSALAVTVPETGGQLTTLGEVTEALRESINRGWSPSISAEHNEWLLSEPIREALTQQSNAATLAESLNHWRTSLVRALVLLVFVVERFTTQMKSHPQLEAYISQEYGSDRGSLPKLDAFLDQFDADTPLTHVADSLLNDLVIGLHQETAYQRMGQSGKVRLVFSYDQRTDELREELGTGSASRPFMRYDRVCCLLQDCGYLTQAGDPPKVTQDGFELLERLGDTP